MKLLPILTWEDVWNDIGRQYPEFAGTAFLAVGGRKDWLARAALRFAIRRRSDRWLFRHRTAKLLFLIEDRRASPARDAENEEWSKRLCAELRIEFHDDPRALRVMELLREGSTQSDIAERLGVSRQAIHKRVTKIRGAKCLQAFGLRSQQATRRSTKL